MGYCLARARDGLSVVPLPALNPLLTLYTCLCIYTLMTRKSSGKRVRANFYIDTKQKEDLERLSEKTRVDMSKYVREAIDMVLSKYQKKET